MVPVRTLAKASICLSVVLAVIAFLARDWMWVVIDAVSVVVLLMPHIKGLGYCFTRRTVAQTFVAPVAMIALFILDAAGLPLKEVTYLDVGVFDYLTAAVQTYQCFVTGFMLGIMADRSFGITLTKGWIVIFALVFAMAVTAADFLFMFFSLYLDGYPVFNEDVAGSDGVSNRMVITTPLVATFATMVFAVVYYMGVHGSDKGSLVIEGESTW